MTSKISIDNRKLLQKISTGEAVAGIDFGNAIVRELAAFRLAAMDSESECLPLDYLHGHKDGLEWAAKLAEANHPETGDWLYDDPIELAKAIRNGQDMPPVQPVADSEPDRNPVLAYADSYRDMAKQGVQSVQIWSVITDLERNIAPLYRHAQPAGDVVVTRNERGDIVAVTRHDAEGRVIEVIAEAAQPAPVVVPDGLRLAFSNAGIAAPESDEMLAAICEKHIQALVTWVKDRKPFQSAPLVSEVSPLVSEVSPLVSELTAPVMPVVPDDYQRLRELYQAQEKRLFKIAQRIKGPSFDKYSHIPSQAIDVLEGAIFGEDDACRAAMLAAAPQSPGSEPATVPGKWIPVS